MTPQQKADELIEKIYNVYTKDGIYSMRKEEAVKCAIIAVEEIINEIQTFGQGNMTYRLKFWDEVLTILKETK